MVGLRGAFVFVGLLIGFAENACYFPASLHGTWETSGLGIIDINSTTIGPIQTIGSTELQYDCYIIDGTKYISRSTTISNIAGTDYYFYMCLDLRPQSTNKYLYYMQSDANSFATGRRLPSFNDTEVPTAAEVCNTVLPEHTYGILIKNGSSNSELIPCPNWISGQFNYTSYDGTECVSSGSEMSNCANNRVLYMNYTMCTFGPVLMSVSGILGCLFHTSVGGIEYLTVYNVGETIPGRTFSCLVGETTQNGTEVIASPVVCPATERPSTVVNPASNIIFTFLERCPAPPYVNIFPHGRPPRSSAALPSAALLAAVLSLVARAL